MMPIAFSVTYGCIPAICSLVDDYLSRSSEERGAAMVLCVIILYAAHAASVVTLLVRYNRATAKTFELIA